MEFESNRYELCDLQIDQDHQLIVDCELDGEYSPQDRIENRFCWDLYLLSPDGTRKDITDELSEDDYSIVEQQVEQFFEEFFND
jgi:hypothetical protein